MTATLATLIVVCLLAIVASAVAVYQTRHYATAIIATIFKPEAKMSTSATLTDAQEEKITINVVNGRGKPNTKDTASWSTSDPTVVTLSPVDLKDPASVADPLGRTMWLVGEGPGTATVNINCAGGTLAISVSVSPSPTGIWATVDPPVDLPPPAAPAA